MESNELYDFHQFVGRQLQNGGAKLTPNQALSKWQMQKETIASIQRGLDDVEAGQTMPLEEFDEEFRRKNNIAKP